ncbi:MAG: hypothetical protein HY044_04915 [Candidatus Woesebacteria bacterium]|nr:MAG: hypothetical protein HY044_04915 [Candidatus Woesebacteria bacterium]
MTRIKHINSMSLAKVQAFIFFVFGIINAVLSSSATFLMQYRFVKPVSATPLLVTTFLIMPVLYVVIGFLMGLLEGFLYNLIARRTGGIEVETESR